MLRQAFDRVLATVTFFTRLPLWRLRAIPSEYYSRVVELWPLAGWITGGLTAASLLLFGAFLPKLTAVVLALSVRLLLTGALHEDGLADFADGMGGGTDRDRILAIMKDSHIGTYGVITLIIYYLVLASLLASLPLVIAALTVAVADPWAKCCAAQLINFLPYSRTAETAKNRTVYSPMSLRASLLCILLGAAPLVCAALLRWHVLWGAAIAPMAVVALMILYLRHKIGGYTGDCCGATFLLAELSVYLTAVGISVWLCE